MSDETDKAQDDLDDENGELLPNREAMSILNPMPDPTPDGEFTFPSEPGIGDPQSN